MSSTAWLVFLFVAVPLVGVVVWLVLDESLVRVSSGSLGLLVIRGRATDRALLPGRHFVPAFRKMSVQEYPSRELSYRGVEHEFLVGIDTDLERMGPPLRMTLGDRATVSVSYTLRFRLVLEQLRSVHERFGSEGIWAAVRDTSSRVVRDALNDSNVGVDDLYGTPRLALEIALTQMLSEALAADGFTLTLFSLGETDLGLTGEVVQATVRSRLELEREEAESTVRMARARNDAELQPFVSGAAANGALRYREGEVWRDLVNMLASRVSVPPAPTRLDTQNAVLKAPAGELQVSNDSPHVDES